MQPATIGLFRRVGIGPGIACLEVGCGGSDLAFALVRMVSPKDRVVGTDIDETKLELARRGART